MERYSFSTAYTIANDRNRDDNGGGDDEEEKIVISTQNFYFETSSTVLAFFNNKRDGKANKFIQKGTQLRDVGSLGEDRKERANITGLTADRIHYMVVNNCCRNSVERFSHLA